MNRIYAATVAIGITTIMAGAPASAVPIPEPRSNTLTVQGQILPAQFVVVNNAGTVIYIASNTTEDVIPKAYRDRIANGNEIPLTDDVLTQFRSVVPVGSSKVGVLYDNAPAVTDLNAASSRTSLQRTLR